MNRIITTTIMEPGNISTSMPTKLLRTPCLDHSWMLDNDRIISVFNTVNQIQLVDYVEIVATMAPKSTGLNLRKERLAF